MRITKSKLKSIIREELNRVNERGEVVSLDPETRRGVARLHPTTPEEEEAGVVEIPFQVIEYDGQWRVNLSRIQSLVNFLFTQLMVRELVEKEEEPLIQHRCRER